MHIDLFSGIGGFALAASWVWGDQYIPLAHSDIEGYACEVYHNHFPRSECLGDIKKIDWSRFAGASLLTGGFPCQPFSAAARGRNNAQDLWQHMARAAREVRPVWILAENVPGGGNEHIDRARFDLEGEGYAVWVLDIRVEMFGHVRRRFWLVANSNSNGEPHGPINAKAPLVQEVPRYLRGVDAGDMGVNDGFPSGLHRPARLKALGNAIVPQVAAEIFRAIKEVETAGPGNHRPEDQPSC